MTRILISIGFLLLSAVEALTCANDVVSPADDTLAALKEQYTSSPRDVKIVKAYSEALEKSGAGKEAEAVVREFMSRCPVVQLEDRDTYLLISRYVLEDPYSNAFDYALFLLPRMKWNREDLTKEEEKALMLQKFADIRYGVSRIDEVDKRYEVLALLSRRLSKEIDGLCDPRPDENGGYVLPEYDGKKITHLSRLLDRAGLLGEDGMRTKIAVAEAVWRNDYPAAVKYLGTASDLNTKGIRGSYLIGMMGVLASKDLDKNTLDEAIAILNHQIRLNEEKGTNFNHYSVLGVLYRQAGDIGNAEKYTREGKRIEAEREARYQEMMKSMEK